LDVVRTTIFFLFWMNNVSHDKVIPPNAWLAPSPCRRALNQLCCLKNGELYCYMRLLLSNCDSGERNYLGISSSPNDRNQFEFHFWVLRAVVILL
jgi:hypothetical protein